MKLVTSYCPECGSKAFPVENKIFYTCKQCKTTVVQRELKLTSNIKSNNVVIYPRKSPKCKSKSESKKLNELIFIIIGHFIFAFFFVFLLLSVDIIILKILCKMDPHFFHSTSFDATLSEIYSFFKYLIIHFAHVAIGIIGIVKSKIKLIKCYSFILIISPIVIIPISIYLFTIVFHLHRA